MRRITTTFIVAIAVAVVAQQPQPTAWKSKTGKPTATINFQSNIGSFRFVGTQDLNSTKKNPAEGIVSISFTGTLLLNDVKGKVTATGNLRKEYEAHKRVAYFGTGTIRVEGQFWAIQVFGTKISGSWTGWGMGRLYGEFDENLNTGSFWYGTQGKKEYWSPYGTTVLLPPPTAPIEVAPRERKNPPSGQ